MKNSIKPAQLTVGDTVRLIAPSGFISEKDLQNSIAFLKNLGLKAIYSSLIFKRSGYFAGTDDNRLSDLQDAFRCNKSKAIICIRGGYGVMRLLPKIDYELIKNNPKPLIGYSDITALLQAIYVKTGIIGFHGIVGASKLNDYTQQAFKSVLMQKKTLLILENPTEKFNDLGSFNKTYTINHGIAQGKLIGGNLSLLVSLLGTPFDISWKNKILFVEEINEYPYRIDKFLTQLLLAGKLQELAGIVLGIFRRCDIDNKKVKKEESFSLQEVLHNRLSPLKIPVFYGFSFGHIRQQALLPIGIKAEIDTERKTISLLESAVF